MAAIPVSQVIAAPISAALMRVNWLHLAGWRWLLILEGIPAFIGGVAAFFYLTDWPREAHWLSPEERQWISDELEREIHEKKTTHGHLSILAALRQPLLLVLALSYFLINCSNYGLTIWLPKMVQKFPGLTTWQISLVAAIPAFCAYAQRQFLGI